MEGGCEHVRLSRQWRIQNTRHELFICKMKYVPSSMGHHMGPNHSVCDYGVSIVEKLLAYESPIMHPVDCEMKNKSQ